MRYLLPVLLITACAEAPEDDAFAPAPDDALTDRVAPRYGGCGDTTMYASNVQNTTAIFFELPGLVQAAQAAGRPIRTTLRLPNRAVGITYEEGRNLTVTTCVGAPPIITPVVRNTYDIAGGTLDVVASPTAGGGADVALSLNNPSFQSVGGGIGVGFAIAGSIEIPATGVGFYPP